MTGSRTVPVVIVNASPGYALAPLLAGLACFVLAFLFRRARWTRWAVLAGAALIAGAFLL